MQIGEGHVIGWMLIHSPIMMLLILVNLILLMSKLIQIQMKGLNYLSNFMEYPYLPFFL